MCIMAEEIQQPQNVQQEPQAPVQEKTEIEKLTDAFNAKFAEFEAKANEKFKNYESKLAQKDSQIDGLVKSLNSKDDTISEYRTAMMHIHSSSDNNIATVQNPWPAVYEKCCNTIISGYNVPAENREKAKAMIMNHMPTWQYVGEQNHD